MTVPLYDAQYGGFATRLYAEVRAAAFGEDIGQNGWLDAGEQDLFLAWLAPRRDARLLDVACGSGGPTLRIARRAGCRVVGVDLHEDAIAAARAACEREGLLDRADFEVADAARRLPFDDASFDALVCIDAVNHLVDRRAVFAEWARVLVPGGRLVFTDPVVVTGAVTNEELAARASIGTFLFVPPGLDERLLDATGFDVTRVEDRTANMARSASDWHAARAARSADLCPVEGDAAFDGQQRFLSVTARLAAERRLSRFAFFAARRP